MKKYKLNEVKKLCEKFLKAKTMTEAFNIMKKSFIFDDLDVFISKKDGGTGYMWLINSDYLEEIIEEIDAGEISKMLREKVLNRKSKESIDVN
jgi:hypothetical protein